MLSDIPGLGTALIVLAALTFSWCFIFTACYAAFRLAHRVRLNKQPESKVLRYPAEWGGFTPEQQAKHERWQQGNAPRQHRRFGHTEIKPAPGPRDWEPGN